MGEREGVMGYDRWRGSGEDRNGGGGENIWSLKGQFDGWRVSGKEKSGWQMKAVQVSGREKRGREEEEGGVREEGRRGRSMKGS